MNQRYRPACMWCGHVFSQHEYAPDHFLWCGGRPADAVWRASGEASK